MGMVQKVIKRKFCSFYHRLYEVISCLEQSINKEMYMDVKAHVPRIETCTEICMYKLKVKIKTSYPRPSSSNKT